MLKTLLRSLASLAIAVCFTPLAQAPAEAQGQSASAVELQTQTAATAQEAHSSAARDLFVTVGKSLVVDSPVNIQRVSVANGELAEALAVTPREVLVNGKSAGETSLILWQQGGNRLIFDLTITPSMSRLAAVQRELKKEFPGNVSVDVENDVAFLRGTVPDLTSADRAAAITETLGKTVNLLHVDVPPVEAQILLKVRFASVDRHATQQLGINIVSTGAANTIGSVSTGGFPGPRVDAAGNVT